MSFNIDFLDTVAPAGFDIDFGQDGISGPPFILTQRTSNIGGTRAIFALAYGGGVYVAGGQNGELSSSPDAVTWTARTSSFGTTRILRAAYGNGVFVIVGDSSKLATSSDGASWSISSAGFSSIIDSVTYGDGVFVACGRGGQIASSNNGTSWTQHTSGFGVQDIFRVVWGNGRFVAVGVGGKASISTDGETWNISDDVDFPDTIQNISYGNGLFVAGLAGNIYTSPDGEDWTTIPVPHTAATGAVYVDGFWLISGTNGEIYYTSDFVNWIGPIDAGFGTSNINFGLYAGGMIVFVGADGKIASGAYSPSVGGTEGYIKAWSGSEWAWKPVKVWNGAEWVIKPLKYWNGSTWVVTNS